MGQRIKVLLSMEAAVEALDGELVEYVDLTAADRALVRENLNR